MSIEPMNSDTTVSSTNSEPGLLEVLSIAAKQYKKILQLFLALVSIMLFIAGLITSVFGIKSSDTEKEALELLKMILTTTTAATTTTATP